MSFAAGGRLITNAADRQYTADVCVDGGEPAFTSWTDYRAGGNQPDVYITRIYHTTTGVDDTPRALSSDLGQNFPNPFNPETTIRYMIASAGHVTIAVRDVTGRLVRTLYDGERAPGDYVATWNGRDARGRPMPSGVYLYRIQAGTFVESRKMVLLK